MLSIGSEQALHLWGDPGELRGAVPFRSVWSEDYVGRDVIVL